MKNQIESLMEAHVKVQIGTYFSDCKQIEGSVIKYAYSKKIEDFYWNYAYNINCAIDKLPEEIQRIRDFSKEINRECTIYVTSETNPKNIAEIINPLELEEEVWMIYNEKNIEIENSKLRIEIIKNDIPSSTFMEIFDNSYSEAEEGATGYTGLPKEYLDCISNSKPASGVTSAHFIGIDNDNIPSAVASIFMFNGYAGLYNVGTHHDKRRKGFGAEISKQAISYALKNNCHTLFLQTQADSEVEELYSKIGFKRLFIGKFIKI